MAAAARRPAAEEEEESGHQQQAAIEEEKVIVVAPEQDVDNGEQQRINDPLVIDDDGDNEWSDRQESDGDNRSENMGTVFIDEMLPGSNLDFLTNKGLIKYDKKREREQSAAAHAAADQAAVNV